MVTVLAAGTLGSQVRILPATCMIDVALCYVNAVCDTDQLHVAECHDYGSPPLLSVVSQIKSLGD